MTEKEPTADELRIAAILEEREGYVRFGRKDRLEAVDKELKRLGYKKAEPAGRAGRESQQSKAAAE